MADYAEVFCTVQEVIDDLGISGDEPSLLARVEEASTTIQNEMGDFIPITAERSYDPGAGEKLKIDPLLAVTGIEVDDVALASGDYTLFPRDREWANGPYMSLEIENAVWGEEVEITGRWGKYELTEDVGLTGTQAAAGTATLAVANGAKLSPGMVLLLGTEQELVTAGNGGPDSPDPTAAVSLVNGIVAAADEVITVDNGAEFYAGEVIRIEYEDIRLVKRNGHTWSVKRGWNGTLKAAHANDSAIAVYRTFSTKRGVNGTTAAAHAGAAIYRYQVPKDINYLCRQIAALMRMKAKTGFSGRAGGGEMGDAFFVNEFPTQQMSKIKKNYRTW